MEQRSFEEQKAWADGHINEINRVVRHVAGKIIEIHEASPEKDRNDGIDYEVRVASGSIACRIRRADRYTFRDLTLTHERVSGVTPEVEKIQAGKVRWYLYAWSDGGQFVEWMFLDVDKLRASGLIETAIKQGNMKWDEVGNSFIFISHEALARAGILANHGMRPPHHIREVS